MSETRVRIPELIERLPARERDISTRLVDAFADAGEDLYLVGGIVRDLLLVRDRADLDFTTSAIPARTKEIGAIARPDSIYTVGEEYGTIGFVFSAEGEPDILAEVTTYRSEVYPTEDRRPQVTHGVDLVEDLSRRDFTINAMALNPVTGELVDPFGGISDLAQRDIVAVGDPAERFNEDPLRVLRAARFAAQLHFDIATETLNAMRHAGPQLPRVSRERVAIELNRLLVGDAPARGLWALHAADLIRHILPELQPMADDDRDGGLARHKDIWEHTVRVVEQTPPRLAVRWAALLHDAAKPMTRSVDERGEVHFFGHELAGADLARRLMRRLKQEKALEERVRRLVAMHLRAAGYDDSWTDSAVRRLALEAGDAFEDLLDLAAADVTSARAERVAAAQARVAGLRAHFDRLQEQAELDALQSPLDGDELMAMFDLPPGIWIKIVKERLRELVIDDELKIGDKSTAERLASDWLATPDEELAAALAQTRRKPSG
ncbi:MAG TPA: HD domain-containing protein [Thermomicrobiales bacterium]|nr:HD domain-containing protein [Thermomicrobiales bacterium]